MSPSAFGRVDAMPAAVDDRLRNVDNGNPRVHSNVVGSADVPQLSHRERTRRVRCPYCSAENDRVIDSRRADGGDAVRRRRQCGTCTNRFSTLERVEHVTLTVVKRDGRREPFAPDKLLAGVRKATKNLDLDPEAVRLAVADIEADLRGSTRPDIDSERIGQAMLGALKDLHEVAYVRFASVYKGFTSQDDFRRELESLGETVPETGLDAG